MDDLERQARAELVYRRAQRELGEAQVALKLLADLQKANPKDAVFEAAAGSAARVKGLLYKRVKDLEFAVFGMTATVESLADMKHQHRLSVARKVAEDLGLDAKGLWVCRTCGRAHLWERETCLDCGKPQEGVGR